MSLQHLLCQVAAAFSLTKWTEWPELHCCRRLKLEQPTTAHSEEVGTHLYPVAVWAAHSGEPAAGLKARVGTEVPSGTCKTVQGSDLGDRGQFCEAFSLPPLHEFWELYPRSLKLLAACAWANHLTYLSILIVRLK